jgi:hypothetical protein
MLKNQKPRSGNSAAVLEENVTFNFMKNIQLFFLFLAFSFSSLSCVNSNVSDSLPEGAVPFEYAYDAQSAIIFNGTLNDSIQLRFMLETGMGCMAFSDSIADFFEKTGYDKKDYKNFNIQKQWKVKIGNWESSFNSTNGKVGVDYIDRNSPLISWLGYDIALLPWQFFDGKILEISFSKHYLRELENTENLTDYDSLKMENRNGKLGVPVTVFVQEKSIREYVLFDTGANSCVSFDNHIISNYLINLDSAYYGAANTTRGRRKSCSIPCDSIRLGKFSVTERQGVTFSLEKELDYPFSGLLGTRFLENFDMILDLKNYYLYLKPIEKQ